MRTKIALALSVLGAFLFVACGGSSTPGVQLNLDTTTAGCTPDAVGACTCDNGQSGAMRCNANGQWGGCQCENGDVPGKDAVTDVKSDIPTFDHGDAGHDMDADTIRPDVVDADIRDVDVQDMYSDQWDVDSDQVTVYRDVPGTPDDGATVRDADVSDIGANCPGAAGCSCSRNQDCDSGFCIDTSTGRECARSCDDNTACDKDYKCTEVTNQQGKQVHICVYQYPEICMPCKTDQDCTGLFVPDGAMCVAWLPEVDASGTLTGKFLPGYGNEGAFCGTPCQADSDCPDGYTCRLAQSTSGKMARQCVLKTGTCGCTVKAAAKQAEGACYNRNEIGTCDGTQQCNKDGTMSKCTAKVPKAEVCNDQDDNCDGQTDETFDLETDPKNCGQCNTVCLNQNGTTSCVNGKCHPKCNPGFGDCDGDKTNGCEADLSKVTTCGRCDENNSCPKGFACKNHICVSLYPNGHDCTTADECASGYCTDKGVCCNQECNGPCQSCKGGTCKAVERDGIPEDPDACKGFLCDGNGACLTRCDSHQDCLDAYYCDQGNLPPGPGAEPVCKPDMDLGGKCAGLGNEACKSGFCADGVCCENACDRTCWQCNAEGHCEQVFNAEDPPTCSGTSQCNGQGLCRLKNGQRCATGANCLSDICTDGFCCDQKCDGPCMKCTDKGCQPVKGQDDIPECTGDHTCDPQGHCVLKNGHTCNSDSDCATGECKADYDGQGKWCGPPDQCFHDGTAYHDGQFSPGCWDDANQAKCVNGQWQKVSCGTSQCEGSCGIRPNSCMYHAKMCLNGKCQDQPDDVDTSQAFCKACKLAWNIGGDTADHECCGDDPQEFIISCSDASANGNCGKDNTACCKDQGDCVDQAGNCQSSGKCHVFGSQNLKSFCDYGTWKDPDKSQQYCEADNCGYTWLQYGIGTTARCCGDDPGEDFQQTEGYGRSCCYNGKEMKSGDTRNSLLCFNGRLYDCGNKATDDSGVAATSNLCDHVGKFYCRSDNTWKDKAENGCECDSDQNCDSGHCKADFDGTGAWCGDEHKCMHNGSTYDSGEYAEVCFNSMSRAKCEDGQWASDLCGVSNICATYTCSQGKCKSQFASSDTQCNTDYACSGGTGDNQYDIGGNLNCQGYCDGQGNCDYAGNCIDCMSEFRNADGSCVNSACVMGECHSGWANCDSVKDCEVLLDTMSGVNFTSATSVGSFCGDCNSCKSISDIHARAEALYKVKVSDTGNFNKLKIKVVLTSPVGTNYDLYLYDSGGNNAGKSTSTGSIDSVTIRWNDKVGNDDSRTYYIEVRYKSGQGCGKWTLSINNDRCN